MATMNTFPPDVPKDLDEAQDAAENVGRSLRAKVSNLADKASETAKDAYDRAHDTIADADPVGLARDSGGAVIRAVERHPIMAFGLGALSAGLVAWSALRQPQTPVSRFQGYIPDYGRLRNLLQSYGNEAASTGEGLARSGGKWLQSQQEQSRDYAELLRDYADQGSRVIAKRAEREPLAAIVGLGLAVYVIGSLLTSSSSANAEEPAPRRRTTKR